MALAEKRQHQALINSAIFAYLLVALLLFGAHRASLLATESAWITITGALLRASVAYLVLWICFARDRDDRPLLLWVVQTTAAMLVGLLLASLLLAYVGQLAGIGAPARAQFGRCLVESLALVTLLGPVVLLRGISGMVGDRSFLRLLVRPEMWLGVADASPRPRWWVLGNRK